MSYADVTIVARLPPPADGRDTLCRTLFVNMQHHSRYQLHTFYTFYTFYSLLHLLHLLQPSPANSMEPTISRIAACLGAKRMCGRGFNLPSPTCLGDNPHLPPVWGTTSHLPPNSRTNLPLSDLNCQNYVISCALYH